MSIGARALALVKRYGPTVFGLLLLLGALSVVQREFRSLSWQDIRGALHANPRRAGRLLRRTLQGEQRHAAAAALLGLLTAAVLQAEGQRLASRVEDPQVAQIVMGDLGHQLVATDGVMGVGIGLSGGVHRLTAVAEVECAHMQGLVQIADVVRQQTQRLALAADVEGRR